MSADSEKKLTGDQEKGTDKKTFPEMPEAIIKKDTSEKPEPEKESAKNSK